MLIKANALVALILCAVLAASSMTARGQGSGSSRATPSPPRQPTVEEFATTMWQFINREKSPYSKWASLPESPVAGIESPHGTPSKVLYNDVAAKDLKQLPPNSILLREEFDADGKKLRGVSVMYRVKGSAPQSGDWYWIEYRADGTLLRTSAKDGNKPLAGQINSCIACHRKASSDFVFASRATP